MPLTSVITGTVGSTIATSLNPLFAPLEIVLGIIAKLKGSFLKRLFRRKPKTTFAYMPKYKTFLRDIQEKTKENYLFIDFDDYIRTILNEQQLTEFNSFLNKSDNDLYKYKVIEMVNSLFNVDIDTNKKVVFFMDNEKVLNLIKKKRKLYIYPQKPEDIECISMYASIVANLQKKVISYKSFTDLEDTLKRRV